jgi:hypothetical protein
MASMIAGAGLLADSPTSVIASMLGKSCAMCFPLVFSDLMTSSASVSSDGSDPLNDFRCCHKQDRNYSKRIEK